MAGALGSDLLLSKTLYCHVEIVNDVRTRVIAFDNPYSTTSW